MASASSSLLKTVSPQAIFNLPLYEDYLVIDTRTCQEYETGHVATAVSYPAVLLDSPSVEQDRERTLMDFARRYVAEFCKPENPNPLVIYGSNTQDDIIHTQWLAQRLSSLKAQRQSVTLYSSQQSSERQDTALIEDYDPFEDFCQTVIDKVQEVWLLECPYEVFLKEYPFLCGDVKFEDMFPVPHQITRHIFMGSRVVPITCDALTKMGISHMIISQHQDIDTNELDNTLVVLNCSVRDRNDEHMLPCWEACCKFIDDVVMSDGRVLILLHGRSRSASIVLAYLIRRMGMDFESAWQHLRKECWHLIDRSLVYETQLYEWHQLQLSHAIPER